MGAGRAADPFPAFTQIRDPLPQAVWRGLRVVSVLAALGLFSYATVRGAQAMSQLKAKAAPCEPGSWGQLAQNDPKVLDRVKLLQSMQAQQQALEQIAAEGR